MILKSKSNIKKLIQLVRYKILKPILLRRRDKFIAATIDKTLEKDETGIIFIGACHNVIKRLPKDIRVIELKEVAKIRKYQKAIQSRSKIRIDQIEHIIQYMVNK